jgi:hypothetical protein
VFTGAERKTIFHEALKHKDTCPLCLKGIVYRLKQPGQVICFTGQVPINATIYELEKLRCNLCGEILTANSPGDKTGRDYDAGAMAMIVILKYGYGFPWNRLEKLQESFGIPLAACRRDTPFLPEAKPILVPVQQFNDIPAPIAEGKLAA